MSASSVLARPVGVVDRVRSLSQAAPYAVPAGGFGADTIRLVSGAAAPEALPVDDLRRSADAVLGDPDRAAVALGYGPHPGLQELRSWIATRENAAVDDVLVSNGALHGIALTFAALLDPGDVVVLDDPVFPDTVRIAEQYGARVEPVAVGPAGIDVGAIADLCAAGVPVKIVYTVADFHNPSGGVLPAAARAALVELAERYGFVVVSDNPYRDTTFDGVTVPDFDPSSDRVVRIGTFTKTLGAGLRLGWVIAPGWLAPHLESLRRRTDFHANVLGQALIVPLLTDPGWFDGVVARNRSIHAAKAAVFTTSLRDRLGDRLTFTDPRGGFFVWARISDPTSRAARITADALVGAAFSHGLHLTAGRHFAADGGSQWDHHLRFAFSGPSAAELTVAVDRLAAAFRTLAAA